MELHMKRLLFFLLSILSVATLYADRTISGVVVDQRDSDQLYHWRTQAGEYLLLSDSVYRWWQGVWGALDSALRGKESYHNAGYRYWRRQQTPWPALQQRDPHRLCAAAVIQRPIVCTRPHGTANLLGKRGGWTIYLSVAYCRIHPRTTLYRQAGLIDKLAIRTSDNLRYRSWTNSFDQESDWRGKHLQVFSWRDLDYSGCVLY